MLLIEISLGLCNSFLVVGFLETEESLLKLAFHYQVRIRKAYIVKVLLAKEMRATFDPPLGVNRATGSQNLNLFRDLENYQLGDSDAVAIPYIWILLLHYLNKLLTPVGAKCLKDRAHAAFVAFNKPQLISSSGDRNVEVFQFRA